MKRRYVSVELDVTLLDGETVDQAMHMLTFGFDVSARIVENAGSSGHPVIGIAGPREQVLALMHEGGYHDLEPYAQALDL
jgi:hypothetical protein